MTPLFNRWLPGVTLLVWSGVLLFSCWTGRILNFVVPLFRTASLLAGIAMLLMAGCFLFFPAVASCCDDERCGHPLGRNKFGRLLTFLILIAPISAAAMFSPSSFSLSTAMNRGVATSLDGLGRRSSSLAPPPPVVAQNTDNPTEPPLPTQDGSQPAASASPDQSTSDADQYLPRSKDGNIEVQVIDLLYAAQDDSMRADFNGKTVETIGQLMPDDSHNVSGNRFKLMRMFMWCCAADAKPIAALVEGPTKPSQPDMAWVKVVGKVTFPIEGGRVIPVLQAVSVQQVDPPAETMLY
jgi:uncharacterized repeat protein (TIGR03943 family)